MNNDLQLLALLVQTAGRGRDTVLAHITPEEALLLKLLGGRGSINPQTGLMEFEDGDAGGDAGDDFGSDRNQQERSDLERDLQVSERTASDEEDAAFGADLTAAGGGLGALDGPDGVDYGEVFGPEERSLFGKILDFFGLGSIEDIIETAVGLAVGIALGPAVGAIAKSAIGANVAGKIVGAAATGALSRAAGNLALQTAEEAGLIDESQKTIAAKELGVVGAGFRGAVSGGISGALGGAFGPDLAGSIARGAIGRFGTETAIGVAPESVGGRGLSLGEAVSRGVPAGVGGGISAGLTEALGGGFLGSRAASLAGKEISRALNDAVSRGVEGVVGRGEVSAAESEFTSQPIGATITSAGSQRQPSGVQLSPGTLSALAIRPDIGGRGVTIFGSGDDNARRRSPWNIRSLRVKDNLGVTDE
jgi:hypothetical protein